MSELNSKLSLDSDSRKIREVIQQFLQDRLQPKLEKLKDSDMDARQKLLADYELKTWVADAARRVSQIQQVTHAVKFSHPDAKGSSLSASGNVQAGSFTVGSHTVADALPPDVVGNAAALDVYKFLRLSVDGRTLLERAIAKDPAMAAALSENAAQAAEWMAAFATLPQPNGPLATHKLAKQLYWPLGEGRYHLLAPLFPTSLVHVLWANIRQDRFSDEAKAAREARREQRDHPHGYREYPKLAIQNFGSGKPQNISQLNNDRHGENWLLPSLPPTAWNTQLVRRLFSTESIFIRPFGKLPAVKELTGRLREFLQSVPKPEQNDLEIRNQRAELVTAILAELLQFAAEIQELDGGWSRDERCRLDEAERYWLDPKRAASDEEFEVVWQRGDWQQDVSKRFGIWLNAQIITKEAPMAAPEAKAWETLLWDELRMTRLELSDYA
ncbi:MAG: type I-F CRISPR-associated protein Csy1 [Candidatus Competibacteraceae bacterium]|nr:type I-F CRISPR-associated protein Csy1 [Candidatus Competibacteraceae bacterium]